MVYTPVLFIIFNRPETTARVFKAIRQAKPAQLYIAADGPRAEKPDDNEKCRRTREIVLQVDWDCEVHTLFREKNLGCKYAVSSAIDWFFEHVEEGIILEDDTLPNQSFFHFCEELLLYYKNEPKVMHIAGSNFQFGKTVGEGSYYFSHYNHIWGWATWRRAWKCYDLEMKDYSRYLKEKKIDKATLNLEEKEYWLRIFASVFNNEIDTWDYQWRYSMWNAEGIAIVPNVNLITNLGFGENATHTIQQTSEVALLPTYSLAKIIHPKELKVNKKADYRAYKKGYNQPVTLMNQIRNFSYQYFPSGLVKSLQKLRRKIIPVE